MTTLISILLFGFFLGMRHATDADHVVAVSTFVSKQRGLAGAALTGLFWGIGHSLAILVAGGAIVLTGVVVPERLGLGLEFSVALMLILLGIINIAAFWRGIRNTIGNAHGHSHVHLHGDYIHTHGHDHSHEPNAHGHPESKTPVAWLDAHFRGLTFYQALRPVIVGIVHGLAGSAAVALLVLPLIHDPAWSVVYLLIFGLGTIAGMMLVTAAIAVPFLYTKNLSERFHHFLGGAAGLASLTFGGFLAYQIGIAEKLLVP